MSAPIERRWALPAAWPGDRPLQLSTRYRWTDTVSRLSSVALQQRRHLKRLHSSMNILIYDDRWRDSAVTDAIHFLDCECISVFFAAFQANIGFDGVQDCRTMVGHAGLPHANTDDMTTRRSGSKIRIIREHTGHVGFGHAKPGCNVRKCFQRHITIGGLDRDQGSQDIRLRRKRKAGRFDQFMWHRGTSACHSGISSSPT